MLSSATPYQLRWPQCGAAVAFFIYHHISILFCSLLDFTFWHLVNALDFKITVSGIAIFCIHATSLIVSINTNFVQSPSNSIWFDSSRSPTQHNKWWGCFQDFPYLLFKIHYITKERFLIPVNLQFLKNMMIMISQFRTNVLVSLFLIFSNLSVENILLKSFSGKRKPSQSHSGHHPNHCQAWNLQDAKKQKNWLFEEIDSTQFHFQSFRRGVKKSSFNGHLIQTQCWLSFPLFGALKYQFVKPIWKSCEHL